MLKDEHLLIGRFGEGDVSSGVFFLGLLIDDLGVFAVGDDLLLGDGDPFALVFGGI